MQQIALSVTCVNTTQEKGQTQGQSQPCEYGQNDMVAMHNLLEQH